MIMLLSGLVIVLFVLMFLFLEIFLIGLKRGTDHSLALLFFFISFVLFFGGCFYGIHLTAVQSNNKTQQEQIIYQQLVKKMENKIHQKIIGTNDTFGNLDRYDGTGNYTIYTKNNNQYTVFVGIDNTIWYYKKTNVK